MSDEKNSNTKPGTAMVKADTRLAADGQGVMAITPRDLPEAVKYANGLALSGIVPDSFRVGGKRDNDVNIPLVTMGVLKALEIGMPPQTGLAFLLPINGRFTVWGDGAWALVQREGQLASHTVEWHFPENFDKHTVPLDRWPNEVGCKVSMWRRGQVDPYVGEYSVGRARRAGLWNNTSKKPWITDPERMLFNRARAFPMRDGFADALFGLGITEEVRDITPDKPIGRLVDNSALDDDLPAPPTGDQPTDDILQRANAYEAGLVAIPTLEALQEYQTTPDSLALMGALQRTDEDTYNRVIAANARRYQEIEAAERASERASAEAQDAEAQDADVEEIDPDRQREDRDERRSLEAENKSLFPGDE